jgi:hypothetical protein
MTQDQFQRFVTENPDIEATLKRVAGSIPGESFSILIDSALVALLFPVASFIVTRIGLPWFETGRRYSELQRQRVEAWIDAEYQKYGIDPDKAEAASKALMKELEETTDASAKANWEKFKTLLESKH